MKTEQQWCDQKSCSDFGKIGHQNIKIYSYAEQRYYCTACQRTFSADKGTFFATLRTPRPILLDAVAMLVERNSLRAVSRIKHCTADAVLHWLDLAGQQGAAIHRHFIRDVHPTQVQVDELSVIPGKPPSPVITVSSVLAFRKHRCENTPLT